MGEGWFQPYQVWWNVLTPFHGKWQGQCWSQASSLESSLSLPGRQAPVCSSSALEGGTKALGSDEPLLAVWSWACYLTSLSLYFLLWKRLTLNCRIQWDNSGKARSTWKRSIINVGNFVIMMISWELARFLQIISPSHYPDGKTEVRRRKGTCSRSCSKLEDLGPKSLS